MKDKPVLRTVFYATIFLLIWQFSSMLVGKPVYFPSFLQTMNAWLRLASDPEFWLITGISILRVTAGFIISLLVGVLLAVLCSAVKSVTGLIKTMVGVAKATPVASFIILAMIWFHSSMVPIFVGILMIAPIIFENTLQGISSIDRKIIEMAQVYHIPKKTYLRKIAIPYTKPYLNAAISLSLGIGFKAIVSSEILARPEFGIGTSIYDAKIYLETPELFALTMTVILLSMIFERALSYWTKKDGQLQ